MVLGPSLIFFEQHLSQNPPVRIDFHIFIKETESRIAEILVFLYDFIRFRAWVEMVVVTPQVQQAVEAPVKNPSDFLLPELFRGEFRTLLRFGDRFVEPQDREAAEKTVTFVAMSREGVAGENQPSRRFKADLRFVFPVGTDRLARDNGFEFSLGITPRVTQVIHDIHEFATHVNQSEFVVKLFERDIRRVLLADHRRKSCQHRRFAVSTFANHHDELVE